MLKIPAVVDLPTPPLPDATAIILSTPGIIGLLKGGPRTRPDALLENHFGLFGCHKPCQHNTIHLNHPVDVLALSKEFSNRELVATGLIMHKDFAKAWPLLFMQFFFMNSMVK